MKPARHKPTVPGAVLSIAAGVGSIALRLGSREQWLALLCAVLAIGFLAGGSALRRRGGSLTGATLFAVALVWAFASFAIAVTAPPLLTHRVELVPGLAGLFVFSAGLVPIRRGWERPLVGVGAALLFVGVVTSGVVQNAEAILLFVAGISAILAWDLGEQSVSLGRQLGRGARTIRSELVHGSGSVLAGAGVVVLSLTVHRLGVEGLSLGGFTALLVAGLVLTIALRE